MTTLRQRPARARDAPTAHRVADHARARDAARRRRAGRRDRAGGERRSRARPGRPIQLRAREAVGADPAQPRRTQPAAGRERPRHAPLAARPDTAVRPASRQTPGQQQPGARAVRSPGGGGLRPGRAASRPTEHSLGVSATPARESGHEEHHTRKGSPRAPTGIVERTREHPRNGRQPQPADATAYPHTHGLRPTSLPRGRQDRVGPLPPP